MILPGVSGAFILLILGAYETAIDILNNLVKGVTTLNFDILEPIKRPKRIYYIDKFKETVSGKIKRQETFSVIKPE